MLNYTLADVANSSHISTCPISQNKRDTFWDKQTITAGIWGGAANQTRGQELHPHHQHYSLPPRYDFSGARWLFQQGSSGRVHCELYIYWTWHWAPCTAWALQKEQNISRDGHTHLPLSKRSHAYKDTQSCSQIHCKICQILIDLVHAQQCQVKITGSTLGKKRRI